MADRNVTLQTDLCKENSKTSHQWINRYHEPTVLKAASDSSSKFMASHSDYGPIILEPYALLRGRWLEKASFIFDQKYSFKSATNN
jgi:hypothetical protein